MLWRENMQQAPWLALWPHVLFAPCSVAPAGDGQRLAHLAHLVRTNAPHKGSQPVLLHGENVAQVGARASFESLGSAQIHLRGGAAKGGGDSDHRNGVQEADQRAPRQDSEPDAACPGAGGRAARSPRGSARGPFLIGEHIRHLTEQFIRAALVRSLKLSFYLAPLLRLQVEPYRRDILTLRDGPRPDRSRQGQVCRSRSVVRRTPAAPLGGCPSTRYRAWRDSPRRRSHRYVADHHSRRSERTRCQAIRRGRTGDRARATARGGTQAIDRARPDPGASAAAVSRSGHPRRHDGAVVVDLQQRGQRAE